CAMIRRKETTRLKLRPLRASLLASAILASAIVRAETVSPLYARGYTVLPLPQVVNLGSSDFVFSPHWKLELRGAAMNDIAVQVLQEELMLSGSGNGSGVLRLILGPDSAAVGRAQDRDRDILAQQAYKIDLNRDSVTIAANAPPGLFY